MLLSSWNPARRKLLFRAALLVAVCLSCIACTFLVNDLSAQQCTADADCASLGDSLVCVRGSCVGKAATSDGGTDAAPPCVSNQECTDKNGGELAICEKSSKTCVPLRLSDICPFVAPANGKEAVNDNAVIVAAFLPIKGVSAPLGTPYALAYLLALEEIYAAGGLPGGAGAPRRPVVSLFCDAVPAEEGRVEQGVRHVTRTLKLPAMISLFSQTDMARFIQDYTVPAGTFVLNPQDTTETLKFADVGRLVWHLLGTPEDVAKAYRPTFERVEKYTRQRLGAGDAGSRPLKVALVWSRSPTEQSIATVLRDGTRGILWNGKDANANQTDGNLLAKEVTSFETDPKATFTTELNDLVAYRPDIVVMATAGEASGFVPALDQRLRADGGTGPLPVYVFSTRNARVPVDYLSKGGVETPKDTQKRFLGVQYAGVTKAEYLAEYTKSQNRFAAKYPTVNPTEYKSVENYYDAFYWLAYGLHAAGPGAPASGASFRDGVRKLLAGPRITTGAPADIGNAFLAISSNNQGVEFLGTLGPPNIDPGSGVARSVGAVYCYTQDSLDGGVSPQYNKLVYEDGGLVGDFDCFAGFPL